jgi:sugar phosphate isomerase/epimerase
LLLGAVKIGVSDIVIPCVDQSSLASEWMKDNFVNAITPLFGVLNELNINLSLETDLNPLEFSLLLERFDCSHVTVNYDTGNSASLGYDPVEELRAYGKRITDVHIKDRLLGGASTILGNGDANLKSFFTELRGLNYQGPFILQAYRDDEGLEVFKKQLSWIRQCMGIWYAC